MVESRTSGGRKRIGEVLLELQFITKDQLVAALKLQKQNGHKRLGEIMMHKKMINQTQLTTALARQFGYQYVDLTKTQPEQSVIDKVPQAMCEEYNIIPLKKSGNSIVICIGDPLDLVSIENIRFALNTNIQCVLAPPEDIKRAIKTFYGDEKGKLSDTILGLDSSEDPVKSTIDKVDLNKIAEEDDAPIIKFVHQMIESAVQQRASDIHVEPMEDRVRARFRIDGILRIANDVPKRLQGSLLSRIKIMADMDIAEKRKPQDGIIRLKAAGQDLDIRVSSIASVHGEGIVMRLLDKQTGLKTLEDLGFFANDYKKFRR
ncbi:MAG: Flp pilus assembly complex ATPase component TadA, partial [Planctomycetes bacterium]|nr:Flp pilus assembly complex ATPase component TadA [Planctomycetota bacterium]